VAFATTQGGCTGCPAEARAAHRVRGGARLDAAAPPPRRVTAPGLRPAAPDLGSGIGELDGEGAEPCTALGEPATLILWGDDYDGGYKAWVRWADGRDDIVPGSRVERG